MTSSLQVTRFDSNDHSGLLDHVVLSSSACLAKCSVATINTVIVSALRELCRAEGADHAGWFLLREGAGVLERLDSISTAEVFDQTSYFDSCDLPWCQSCLLRGLPVMLTGLRDLPGHAERDRAYLQNLGVQSLVLVPMDAGETEIGVLAIVSLRHPSCWSSTLPKQCLLLGNAFLSARARKTTYQEIHPGGSDFQEAFRSASVGMAIEDTSGGLLYVNEALCTMLGYTETQMVHRRCVDFSHPADLDREAILFDQLFRGERQGYEIEKRFLSRSGATIWGKVNVTLLREHSGRQPLILGIVEDITPQKSVLEKLTRSQQEVQTLASRIMLSQEDERRSIARELHDDIGQRLSLVTSEIHLLNSGQGNTGQPRVACLDRLTEELDSLVTDLHNLSHRLHSSKLQHLGLGFTLRELCRRMSGAGLLVDLTLDEEVDPIPQEAGTCLLRVAQEALNNVLKHSGASQAFVILAKATDGYSLTVRDAGKGFDPEALVNGLGLISMRERVRLLEGYLTIHSGSCEGTEVVAWVPRIALVN